jgi:hypothetical protein
MLSDMETNRTASTYNAHTIHIQRPYILHTLPARNDYAGNGFFNYFAERLAESGARESARTRVVHWTAPRPHRGGAGPGGKVGMFVQALRQLILSLSFFTRGLTQPARTCTPPPIHLLCGPLRL